MDANENPYNILRVPPTATAAEIRSAYRRLALQTHPDKQRNEQDRQCAAQRFAKISNAYEILSDPEQKRQYDRLLQQQQAAIPPLFATTGGGMPDIFQQFFRHSMFHDPFQVFEQFFRDEMTMGASNGGFGSAASSSRSMGAGAMRGGNSSSSQGMMMNDPFSLMMGGPSLWSGGTFGGDLFGMGTAAATAGGSLGSMFGTTTAPHSNAMLNAGASLWNTSTGMQQQQQQMATSGGSSTMFFSSSSTSSSSQMFGGGTGETITVQTTMRSINGQPPRMVRERIVQKADGTVERTILQSENGPSNAPSSQVAALEAPAQTQQQQLYLPSSVAATLQPQQQQPPITDNTAMNPPSPPPRKNMGTKKSTARKKRSHTESNHQNGTLMNVKRPKDAPNASDNSTKKTHLLPDTVTEPTNSDVVNGAKKVKLSSVTTKQEPELPLKDESKAPTTAISDDTHHTVDSTSFTSRDKKVESSGIVNRNNKERSKNDSESLSSPKESSSKAATKPAVNLSLETKTTYPANEGDNSGSDH